MYNISGLDKIIYIVPDLIDLFLSGFIFMTMFNWFNNRKAELATTILWSLFVSYMIKNVYSVIFLLKPNSVETYVKSIIYVTTGALLSVVIKKLKSLKCIMQITRKINNKTLYNDLLDNVIDYTLPIYMQVYPKGSNHYYIGRFAMREENGIDSLLALIDYKVVDKEYNTCIYNPQESDLKSSMIFFLKDIEHIEIIYENESCVWKHLSGTV